MENLLESTLLDFFMDYWWLLLILLFIVYIAGARSSLRENDKAHQTFLSNYKKKEALLHQQSQELTQQKLSLLQEKNLLIQREADISQREKSLNELVRRQISTTVQAIAQRDYLSTSTVFSTLRNAPDNSRLLSALQQKMQIRPPFQISAQLQVSSGEEYHVTLDSCTCKDFQTRHIPCKHMYRLAAEVGALLSWDFSPLSSQIAASIEKYNLLLSEVSSLENQRGHFQEEKDRLQRKEKAFQRILSETNQSYPWLAKLYADYLYTADSRLAERIIADHPRSSRVTEELLPLNKERRQLRHALKEIEYQLHFYETIFPWLEEFRELTPTEAYQAATTVSSDPSDEYESLRYWLSPEEYNSLPPVAKYQLALDRYRARKKTNWEAGIEYERYIGYLCEQKGYKVQYSGATLGLEDMGRDLVLSLPNQKIVIQCKRWGQEKTIHEKHIFQLFGSCVLLETQNQDCSVTGGFVTTAELSDMARKCASLLSIQVFEHVPMSDYPVIKCNISRTGEKIYHLPFDQQYDRVIIDPERGEFYAMTVAEAENAGFRHAFRHVVNAQA